MYLSSLASFTYPNTDGTAIAAKIAKITNTTDSNKYYNLTWKSDDGKTINAHLTKNKDVKIISKSK